MFKRSRRQSGFWVSGFTLMAVACYAPSAVRGATWYVDDDAPLGGDGTSWQSPLKYLQDALLGEDHAQAGDEIRVAGGIYKPDEDEENNVTPLDREATFQLIDDVEINGGYAGYGAPDPDERDIWLYESILSGDLLNNDVEGDDGTVADNSYHVVSASSSITTDTVLDGFTITAGNARLSDDPDPCDGPDADSGAGLYNVDGSPTVCNCRFVGNRAKCHGGGMANFDVNSENGRSQPIVYNCVFEDNWAGSISETDCSGGGGMYNGDATAFAPYDSGSDPTVENCLFVNNRSGHAELERDLHYGAGMRNDASHPLVVNCIFTGNYASAGYGGAIANLPGSRPIFVNCTIADNTTGNGCRTGGIYNESDPPDCLTVPTVTNCILWGNTDGDGWTDTEREQIYYDDASDPNDPNHIPPPVVEFSCIQGCDYFCQEPSTNIDDDPNFLDPQHRGYYLKAGSACIDAGDNTAVPEGVGTDFDGSPRFIDDPNTEDSGNQDPNDPNLPIVDMGAYEYDPDAPRICVWPTELTFYAMDAGSTLPDDQTFEIRNGGGGTLDWTIQEECSWLQAEPMYGQTTGDEVDVVTLSIVDITGLAAGRHDCQVQVVDDQASNSPVVVHVTLYVGWTTWYVDDDNTGGPWDGSYEHPFQFIQDGIDAAGHGDVVVVLHADDHTYTGEKNRDLDFKGRNITVRSESGPADCVIDCESIPTEPHRAFYFHSGETSAARIEGFTITNGEAPTDPNPPYYNYCGGAVLCRPSASDVSSSPTIRNCVFNGNAADFKGGAIYYYLGEGDSAALLNCAFSGNASRGTSGEPLLHGGGAVYCECADGVNAAITIVNCTFNANTADLYGGGLSVYRVAATVTNCEFFDNTGSHVGGGVFVAESGDTSITNCSFAENDVPIYQGAAVFCWECSPTITNCVVWGNVPETNQINFGGTPPPPAPVIRYCDVQSGYWDQEEGNIIPPEDPNFVSSTNLRLRITSPCIDVGDPNAVPFDEFDVDEDGDPTERTPDLDLDERVERCVVDMGAYEFHPLCVGDLNLDGLTDLHDLSLLLKNYGVTSGASYEDGDIEQDPEHACDEDVDLMDLATLLSDYGCISGGRGGGSGGGRSTINVYVEAYDTGGYSGGGFEGEVDHFVFDLKIELSDPNDDWVATGGELDTYNDATFRLSTTATTPDQYATFVAAPWTSVPQSATASVAGAYDPPDPTSEFTTTGINLAWFDSADSNDGPATVLRLVIDVSDVEGADVSEGFGSVYFSTTGKTGKDDILVADLVSETGTADSAPGLKWLSGEFYVKGE